MTRVSSESSAPVSVLGPSAIAATIRARLVRLFEPGTRTRLGFVGPGQGVTVIAALVAAGFAAYLALGRKIIIGIVAAEAVFAILLLATG